jgi:soluble lytic murein transglycosylase-like protein
MAGVPSIVPAQYRADVASAAQATGLPVGVVAWQIQDESGFDPNVTSPTGAQGIAQFEPDTWKTYGKGSPFDPQAAFTAYSKFMSALLKQEGGSVFKALEAYNAGPGNLPAGASYATTILRQAGQPSNAQATPAGSMVSTGLSLNPFSPITSAFGTDLTHIAIRLGLILLGGALVILGLVMMNEKRAKAVLRTGAEAALVAPK